MKKLIYLLLFVTTVGFSQQTQYQKIDSLLTFLNQNNKFMGSIALRENDKVVFAKTYGYADVEANKLLNNDTKLKIGSITKTFTATLIMQLIDEKKLSLETKLSKFYPKIPNAKKITMRHLLQHRSGIPDFLNDDPNSKDYIYIHNSKEDVVKRIAAYTPAFEPDAKFAYSNSNYNLLGYIIETITHKTYQENLQRRIFDKIGLKNTSFTYKINPNNNEGYSYTFSDSNWEKTPEWDGSLAFSAGAIASTTLDVTLFFNQLFSGKLVSDASLQEMKTINEGYGFGLVTMPFYDKTFFGHTGGIENFRAVVGYNVEEHFGVSLIVNGDNFLRNDIMIGVLSLYYEKPYTFPDLKGFTVTKEQLEKYTGNYTSKTLPLKIQVFIKEGKLMAQATGQGAFELTAKSETEFEFAVAGIKMLFAENKFTLKQAGMTYEYQKEN